MNLLGRAQKLLRNLGPAEPPRRRQYYRVVCSEGHILRGERTEGFQAIRCPGCGEGLFVLPRSPLPEPPAPATTRPKRKAPKPVEDEPIRWVEPPAQAIETAVATARPEPEIEWEEEAPARRSPASCPARRPGPARGRPSPAPSPPPAPRARHRAAPGDDEGPTILLPQQPDVKRRLWRHRHLLAVLGVGLLVVATVGFRLFRQWLEDLPRIAEENRAVGLKALEAGDFDAAKKSLAQAAGALERLGDPDAPKVRQAADEAAIITDLAGLSLEELIEQVATRPGGWEGLKTVHRGRSLLIDTRIAALPRGGRGYDLEYRIFGGSREGRIDLADLRLFEGQSFRVGDPVTFGARLDAIALGDDRLWHVHLIPDSGVFLTTPQGWKATEHLGWPSRDQKLEDLP